MLQTEPPFHGSPVAAVAADSYERAREALALVEVEWEELEPLLDPEEAVRQESFVDEPRSYERGDVDAGFAEADVVVEAEYRTQTVLHNAMETHQSVCALGRRHARDLHLDPVHLGHPRLGLRAARAAARPRARGLQLHGRRLRREERARRLHVHRDRARRQDRPAGALRAHPPRGEPRHRQPQRHDPEAARRRALGRDARRARGRVREHDRLDGLLGADLRADRDALRLRERAHADVRHEAEPAAERGLPRARLRRRHVRARVRARRARRSPGARPARAAAAQPRRQRPGRRPAVLVQEAARVLRPRRRALGAARSGARELRRADPARHRAREPDLVRRRRAALVRVGARRLRRPRGRDHRDAGHRHGHADGDGADRRRGARAAARPRPLRARRLGARAVRLDLGRLVDHALDGPGRARRRRGRRAADHRDRRAAPPPRGARALAQGRQRSSPPTAARGRSRR